MANPLRASQPFSLCMLFFVFLLYSRFSFSLFLVTASEDAEQVKEEIDKVEIQSQGSDECQFLCALAHVVLCLEHLLDLLTVPSGQANEDGYAGVTQNVIKSRTLQEHVYYGSDNQTNQRHEEYFS